MFATGNQWPRRTLEVPGAAALSVHDSGGSGRVLVLLHGLGGHALEWGPLASRLQERYRVVGFDQRGHGVSTTRPDVGQSFGAHTALLVAASRPDLVTALVLVEGGVGGGCPSTDRRCWSGAGAVS